MKVREACEGKNIHTHTHIKRKRERDFSIAKVVKQKSSLI